ncbi:ATP-binding protein [Streptomyces sp. NPDC004726]
MPMIDSRPDEHASRVITGFEVSLHRAAKPGVPLADGDRLWPSLMRRVGRAHLHHWGLGYWAETVELLLSELVTNGLEHGYGSTVDIRLWRTEAHLRIEVDSGGPYAPPVNDADPLDEGGRGLHLVGALADGWGVTADGTWCVLAIDGSA